ncbi:gp53-like domain-containing protein [Qipengyuania flava]|uniref:gp53-like domain-containing protein n=1 Tax=Qipengyuania flava TaxID=192812 RepID=UPI00273CF849|nr:hypothetical protein [Qipengyuania flava]
MAEPIDLVITNAGLDALVDAQNGNTDAIEVVEVGLTETAFDPAPTLIALPGETKRLASVAGQSVAPDIIHMVALDATTEAYELRGIGLYLADGTLFATYGQANPIFIKVTIADFLLALDVRFSGDIAEDIIFGDSTFLYPPASETVKGVARLASQAMTDAGDDDETIVTPLKLASRLLPVLQAIAAEEAARISGDSDLADAIAQEIVDRGSEDTLLQSAIDALRAITITGAGLATGGGNLTANRQISVTAATGAEIAAGTSNAKAVTPQAIAGVPQTFGGNCSIRGLGGAIFKTGTVSAAFPGGGGHTFPAAFPNGCYRVLLTPLGDPDGGDEADETWWVTGVSATGFNVAVGGDGNNITMAYLAIGN